MHPRLPHSREQSKRRRFSLNLIRMILARLSRLCTERANPLLHQFSSTKTLVERLYSSVLLTLCRHSISILTERLSSVLLPKRTYVLEDMLRWLYKSDKTNRDTCKNWRAWSREKFVEHLHLLYPQCQMQLTRAILR